MNINQNELNMLAEAGVIDVNGQYVADAEYFDVNVAIQILLNIEVLESSDEASETYMLEGDQFVTFGYTPVLESIAELRATIKLHHDSIYEYYLGLANKGKLNQRNLVGMSLSERSELKAQNTKVLLSVNLEMRVNELADQAIESIVGQADAKQIKRWEAKAEAAAHYDKDQTALAALTIESKARGVSVDELANLIKSKAKKYQQLLQIVEAERSALLQKMANESVNERAGYDLDQHFAKLVEKYRDQFA